MRLKTAPTGSGGNIELPNYFLKPHETAPTPTYRDRSRPAPIISLPRFIGEIETEGRKRLFIFAHVKKLRDRSFTVITLCFYMRHFSYALPFALICLGTLSPIQAQPDAVAPHQYRRIPHRRMPQGAATKHQTTHQVSECNRYP